MKKRWIAAVAAGILLSLGGVMTAMADEAGTAAGPTVPEETSAEEAGPGKNAVKETVPEEAAFEDKGTWKEENGSWKYYSEDGTYKKNCWARIGGYWYRFDREGNMVTGWVKVGGYYYFFRETGDLAIGWCYNDEEEKWYYFDQDGYAKKGWYQDDDGSWYWFTPRGEMVSSGYRTIDGSRYYFYENGQMAANQYVGLYYMDENGQRDKRYDIVIEGKSKDAAIPSETKDEITEALKNIPRGWIRYFVDHGWQILYYPDKEYFSAPESGGGTYYVYHKLDTSYRKIKFCKPEALTEAFGEYIGYAADCYDSDSQFAVDLSMNKGNVDEFVDVPDYYSNDMKFYFGKLVEAYLSDSDTRAAMEEDSPQVCEILRQILYAVQDKKSV